MKHVGIIFLIGTLFLSSCNKNKNGNGIVVIPSNFIVTANPSTDNSGNVAFVATATNAVSYEYDFGNGVFQTLASGTVTYKYLASGTYSVNVIAKSSGGQTISKNISVTVSVALSLIWSDEFNVAGAPDPAKWGYDIGAGGWGNAELQYYTDRADNASVSGGTLKIWAKTEAFSGSPYTSARLLSKNKFSFKYGKVEASAKMPVGIGTWPAIWMLGDNINTVGWPACGEIDIMEHKGSLLNKIYGTLHYTGHSGGNAIGDNTTISNATSAFHKYGVEWRADFIKFYVDDVEYFSVANTNTLPFNQNFFLLMNVAMGGTFGGSVEPTFSAAAMEVDYIRVYQ